MKNILILVLVAAVGAANAATVSEFREGKEITLAPLKTPQVEEVMSCGRYFYRTKDEFFPGGPLVTLQVERGGIWMPLTMRRSNFRLVINPAKRVPTITFVPTLPRLQSEASPAQYFWIIQMDEQEGWMARQCFPPPVPDPRAI